MRNENKNTSNKKKVVRGASVALCVAALGMGAMSYFTDYKSQEMSAKAGNLHIDLTMDKSDLNGGLTIINPGDKNPLEFTVSNTGEKSVDVKHVVTITTDMAMTNGQADQEFKLVASDGTDLKASPDALKIEGEGSNTVIYTFADFPLAGSIEKDAVTDGTTTATKKLAYKFAMDEDAQNAWQGKTPTVKVETYAKQHRNTQENPDWQKMGEWHLNGFNGHGVENKN